MTASTEASPPTSGASAGIIPAPLLRFGASIYLV